MESPPRPHSQARRRRRISRLSLWLWDSTGTSLVNLLALFLIIVYLFPMTYMIFTAVKQDDQFSDIHAPIWPAEVATFTYQDTEYPLYNVPTEQGVQQWALVVRHRQESEFVDPAHPEAGLVLWEGRWRTLQPVYTLKPTFLHFVSIWESIDFPKLLRNTLVVTALGEMAVLPSSILVAYGFSRFRIPGSKILFLLLIATIIVPEKITLVPTYFIFVRVLNWNGTWWPLIAPLLFGNAALIFLLRQNFKSIPRDMEEAAMLDGAGPLRILTMVILPQCKPAITTVGLLHFFYAWNEIRTASLYLGISPELHTMAFGIQRRQGFGLPPNGLQASALITMVVPVAVLFLCQRVFMQDMLITGLEK